MKEWTVEIYILDQDGTEHPAKCFTKVVYNLHPSFENPQQSTFPTPHLLFTFVSQGLLTSVCNSVQRAALQMHQRGMGRV